MRLLRQVADLRALGGPGLAGEIGIKPGHDLHQGRFTRAVHTHHTDFDTGQKAQVNVLETFLAARIGLGDPLHVIDVLIGCHVVPLHLRIFNPTHLIPSMASRGNALAQGADRRRRGRRGNAKWLCPWQRIMPGHPSDQILAPHRAGKAKALNDRALGPAQHVKLTFGFDTFGHHLHFQKGTEADNGAHDHPVAWIAVQPRDHLPIKLNRVNLGGGHMRQADVTGAEIIKRHAHTKPLKPLYGGHDVMTAAV